MHDLRLGLAPLGRELKLPARVTFPKTGPCHLRRDKNPPSLRKTLTCAWLVLVALLHAIPMQDRRDQLSDGCTE